MSALAVHDKWMPIVPSCQGGVVSGTAMSLMSA
jgi:hypothetical protein